MKLVIDTNVVVSAIFFGGHPRELLELLVQGKLTACVTPAIIAEYRDTIAYLQNKYASKPVSVSLSQIIAASIMVDPVSDIRVCRDPDDDKFLNCALDANCHYIISGDQDLLTLEQYSDIRIISVAEFLRQFCDDIIESP